MKYYPQPLCNVQKRHRQRATPALPAAAAPHRPPTMASSTTASPPGYDSDEESHLVEISDPRLQPNSVLDAAMSEFAAAPLRTDQKPRGFIVVINNYTDDDVRRVEKLFGSQHVKHAIYAFEVGASGTPHIQGYVEFRDPRTWKSVKKALPRAALFVRKGSPLQAWVYCEKESTPEEKIHRFGTKPAAPAPGRRTDLERATAIVAERGLTALAQELPVQFVLHHRGFEALQARLAPIRTRQPTVTVLWGPTGTGKSHTARQLAGEEDTYIWHPQQGTWFDGYEGQTCVIFEEFRGQIPFGTLLSLLDKYDCRVQKKGSSTQFAATKIIFTSPVEPKDWYETLAANDGKLAQLERRITETRHLSIRVSSNGCALLSRSEA